MLLVDDFLTQWENIVNQVDKNHVPIEYVRKIIFRTSQRKQKTINLGYMRNQGLDAESIEKAVSHYIEENEEVISSMEFVLDVEAVAQVLQPKTDKLLNGL